MASVAIDEHNAALAVGDDESFPLYVEFFVVFFLIVVFSLWNRRAYSTTHPRNKAKLEEFRETKQPPSSWCKAIEEKGTAGEHKEVMRQWTSCKDREPLSQSATPHVVKALFTLEPSRLSEELADHMARHCTLRDTSAVASIVDAVATTATVEALEDFVMVLETNFGIARSVQMQESMAGAYAYAAKLDKMEECLAALRKAQRKASAKCHCSVLRGLLHVRRPDEALKAAKEMKAAGYTISPYLVTEVYRSFCKAGRASEVMSLTLPEIPPSSHAAVMLLEQCQEKTDLQLAKYFQTVFEREGTELCPRAHETMLKVLVVCGDVGAFDLFETIRRDQNTMTEGFAISLLTRSAESKFLKFAEHVVEHVRQTSGMTVALYSAHMKVYANSGMYDKACDIFEKMREEGIEPDQAMCNPMMWYAAECGRQELSKELADQSPQLRAHRWMSSIRSCVKDKDIDKAIEYLNQAMALGCRDVMIFNCALDVCAAAGDVERARELLKKMHMQSRPDLVSYNTALKCYSTRGDIRGAKRMLGEMAAAGFPPNEVSYNVIINMAVTSGSFRDAWDMIEVMTTKGAQVDCYTISTLLKAVKKSNSHQDLTKVLSLMDRLSIDVSTDEVLMNCVLEMCLRHRLTKRMQVIISNYSLRDMKPSPHTYGMLFRACAELRDLKRCFTLWDEMVSIRGIEPNKVTLAAMVDALASAGRGDAACKMIDQWKAKVVPTMAMYQTVLKGFPSKHGVALVQELRKSSMMMTTMLYNLLIDGQAKAGNMDEVVQLLDMMEEDTCKPDNFTVSLQVKGYCYSGQLKRACDVFEKSRHLNNKADTVAFNTLLDGCIRHNDFTLADDLVSKIEDYNITPSNFTVGIIIKMWGRRRQLDKCFQAADEFCSKYDIVPSGPVRTCLMSACVLNNDVDRAFEVLETIRSGGQSLDAKAHGSMVCLCIRHGRLDDALRLADEVATPTCTKEISPEVLDQLANALSKAGQLEMVGIKLFRRLHSRGVNVYSSGQVTAALGKASA